MGRTQPEMISKLRAFRRSVARKYGIEKAILFGSHATGRQRKDSDVDILVVSRRKGKLRLISKLYHEWHVVLKLGIPVDFICYTPGEFDRLRRRATIVREAVRDGIEIA